MRMKFAAVVIAVVLGAPFALQYGQAHGMITVKDCTAANLPYNEDLYKEDIMSINQAASLYVEGNPHYRMADLASYMVTVYLNQPVELAHCLRDMGVSPSSVSQLSPLAWGALVYDRQNLLGYSHDFLKEIPAPQVPSQQMLHPMGGTLESKATGGQAHAASILQAGISQPANVATPPVDIAQHNLSVQAISALVIAGVGAPIAVLLIRRDAGSHVLHDARR